MITEATPYDVAQLGQLGGAFIERSISSRFISFDSEGFVNGLFRLLSLGHIRIWVAKEGKTILGAVGLILAPNLYNPQELLGDIYFIDVLPEHQKKGIAREFITTVESWCVQAGVKALTISFKQKEIADRVCQDFGFEMFEYKLIKKVGD